MQTGEKFDSSIIIEYLSPNELAIFMYEVNQYLTELGRLKIQYGFDVNEPGFNNLPEELCQPFSAWLSARGFRYLQIGFVVPITDYGYGSLVEIPVAYAVKYMNQKNFFCFFSPHQKLFKFTDLAPEHQKYFQNIKNNPGKSGTNTDPDVDYLEILQPKGFQDLLIAIKDYLMDVRLNQDILAINRTDGQIEVITLQNKLEFIENFDQLIVTVPPKLDLLQSFMVLTPAEQAIFSKVFFNDYVTCLAETNGFDQGGYSCLIVKEIVVNEHKFEVFVDPNYGPAYGQPHQFFQPYNAGTGLPVRTVFYIYDDISRPLSTLVENLKNTVQNWGNNGQIINIELSKQWKYFPHALSTDLAGFYPGLEALQGQKNTYWVSGLLNFELTENCAHYASNLVSTKFVGLQP